MHTGHAPYGKESHPTASGILNSLSPKSIASQAELGPIRAVLHNVVEPALSTYKDKLLHMKQVQDAFKNPEILRVVEPHVGIPAITKLIESTRREGREGVVVTSLTEPEHANIRIKIKHQLYYNLRVVGFEEEIDKYGKPKGTLGAFICADRSGAIVANVGTGLSDALRKEVWINKGKYLNSIIQVKTMGLARQKLRMPVFNGFEGFFEPDVVL
jgi:hypothetical protein